jgi:hypothetical protein
MTDLAQFIVASALAAQSVSISWLVSTIQAVALEISRRTRGEGIVNETEIWNSLLGKACTDAEQEVAVQYREMALAKLSVLPDLDSVLRFDVVATRDELLAQAQDGFRQKCTGQRADLLQLIPNLIEESKHRLRKMIEDCLQLHRSQLLRIFEARRDMMRTAEARALEAIDGLSDDQVEDCDLVWRREQLYQELAKTFMATMRQNADGLESFRKRVSESKRMILITIEAKLYLRHAARMKHGMPRNIQSVVKGMFPVGTVLGLFGTLKPSWMDAEWERLEPGRVLVSSGDSSPFLVESTGGDACHNHKTQVHVLTIAEMPAHNHAIGSGYDGNWDQPWRVHMDNGFYMGGVSTEDAVGNTGHDHGDTDSASTYPPYVCVTFWRRVR